MLLQVSTAVEAGRAEIAGERPLPGVDDDMSGELRAALLVLAADVADEALRRPLTVGVDDLAVSLQVAEASEGAAAEVAAVRSNLAVDQRVTREQ